MPKRAKTTTAKAKRAQPEGQLLQNTILIDNPKLRDELVAVIDVMAELDEVRKSAARARRKYDDILGTFSEGLQDGDSVDVLVGEKYYVRLVARKRDARKASKPGLTVSKKWNLMPDGAS